MDTTPEKIIVLESDPRSREEISSALRAAGYDVAAFATTREGLDAIQQGGADILLMDSTLQNPSASEDDSGGSRHSENDDHSGFARGGAECRRTSRSNGFGGERRNVEAPGYKEVLARVRARLRVQRLEKDLRDKMRIAEEGQQIAHTAFEALAVTEKMTSDAFSLDRKLKTGFAAVFAIAILMAGIISCLRAALRR